jgi:hypothetical protein
MQFILEEHEYKELQSYKLKYDKLKEEEELKKEEFLEEYFDGQDGDLILKYPVTILYPKNKEVWSYYKVNSNDPRFERIINKSQLTN